MVNSFSKTVDTDADVPAIRGNETGIGEYLNPTTLKYLAILVFVYIGLFRASFFNAVVLGVIGGILFSPEIRQVPVLAEYSVIIEEFVSNVIADIKQRIAAIERP